MTGSVMVIAMNDHVDILDYFTTNVEVYKLEDTSCKPIFTHTKLELV